MPVNQIKRHPSGIRDFKRITGILLKVSLPFIFYQNGQYWNRTSDPKRVMLVL